METTETTLTPSRDHGVTITWDPNFDQPTPESIMLVHIDGVKHAITRKDAVWLAEGILRHAGTKTVLA